MHDDDAEIDSAGSSEVEAISTRIDRIRAGRGYVFPSHAVLAATHPNLLVAYEAVYSEITFRCIALTPFEKNFVWLLVVGAMKIPIGGHHVSDFREAGGTARHVEVAVSLAALLAGAGAFEAVGPGWKAVVPEMDAAAAYDRALTAIVSLAPPLPGGLLDIGLAAANACLLAWDRFGRHLANAKKLGVADAALAEALSVTILPAGNPVFVRACAHWRDMVESGRLAASPELRHAFRQIGSAASPNGQGA